LVVAMVICFYIELVLFAAGILQQRSIFLVYGEMTAVCL
jgi:hypothetical protein